MRSLQVLARKEVAHQPLTTAEMDGLGGIGGEVEVLTLEILELSISDPLPDRERHLGTVADVYAHNGTVLEEAVGAADLLYVVVEINNTPVLAQGAMLSYYEFTSPTRLADEEWKAQLLRAAPPRPAWLRDLLVTVPALHKSNGNTSVGGQTQYD